MKRHRAHWAVLVLGCIWLFVLYTRLNRAFRSVFRFASDNISDNFCIVCTQTAFFIEKQKAFGDFQIIFKIILASFVPGLSPRKKKSNAVEYLFLLITSTFQLKSSEVLYPQRLSGQTAASSLVQLSLGNRAAGHL